MSNEALDIIDDIELRNTLMVRLEVLDKVKMLLMIPKLDMVTTQQVADFFEVDFATVKKCVERNSDEISQDGTKIMTSSEFRQGHYVSLKSLQKGSNIYDDGYGNDLRITNAKTTFFSKRAILRIAMLLRDSRIAREIRTQLLNTLETTSLAQRTAAITEEQLLLLDIVQAMTDSQKAEAMNAYRQYMLRYKTQAEQLEVLNGKLENEKAILTSENEAYAKQHMVWTDHAILDKLVKIYAAKAYKHIPLAEKLPYAWGKFYDELYYDERISLYNRRPKGETKSVLHYVREDEWPTLIRKAFAMCRSIGCNVECSLHNDVVYQQVMEYSDTLFPGNASPKDRMVMQTIREFIDHREKEAIQC